MPTRAAKSPARSRPNKASTARSVKIEPKLEPKIEPKLENHNPFFAFDGAAIVAAERAFLFGLAEAEKRYKEARSGFVKKVFGLLTAQLVATALICAAVVYFDTSRQFVLASPNLIHYAAWYGGFGLLAACYINRYQHPTNLLCLAAFTANEAYVVSYICSSYYDQGFGQAILVSLGLTSLTTVGLTIYALRSKKDFSFMSAGLYAALWALIIAPVFLCFASWLGVISVGLENLFLGVAGTLVFSLYIIHDVWLISKKLPLDDYVHGVICLYLDILNLFLDILRVAAETKAREARAQK